jgi:hypothetical protein
MKLTRRVKITLVVLIILAVIAEVRAEERVRPILPVIQLVVARGHQAVGNAQKRPVGRNPRGPFWHWASFEYIDDMDKFLGPAWRCAPLRSCSVPHRCSC